MYRMMSCIVLVMVLLSAIPAAGEDNTLKKALWVEGGATLQGNYSVALGTRLGPIGMKFGYGGDFDYEGKEVNDAYPFTLADLGVAAKPVGKKKIDPAFGFDMMGFYDFTRNLTGYAEGGVYWQEERKVMVVTEAQRLFAWPAGTLFNVEKKRYVLTVEGGAGIQYRIPYDNWHAVLLTAGYHTLRGVSGGIGLAF